MMGTPSLLETDLVETVIDPDRVAVTTGRLTIAFELTDEDVGA